MTDVQTLDLASGIRAQDALALKIALVVSGFGARADAGGVLQDIERFQQDVLTRTALNTVAGYSNSGGVFGYQIGPSLAGVVNVARDKRHSATGPQMVLQRQSFPVLVFVGLDRSDLLPQILKDPASKKLTIVEPKLQFRQTTRWIPIKKSRNDPIFESRPRLTEVQRLRVADELREAANDVEASHPDDGLFNKKCTSRISTPADVAYEDYIRNRIAVLRSHVVEAFHFQAIPISAFLGPKDKDASPKIQAAPVAERVIPANLPVDWDANAKAYQPVDFLVVVSGRNLADVDVKDILPASAGYTIAVDQRVSPEALVLRIQGKPTDGNPTPLQVRLEYNDPADKNAESPRPYILTPVIQIIPKPKAQAQAAPQSEDTFTLRRTRMNATQQPESEVLTVPRVGYDGQATRAFIEGAADAPAQDNSVNVKVNKKD
ncbi:MAG: hypothetical protein IPK83_08100 [Planctomycetes bacterium]|nr:hypothetical protein [Planctomycetota bacterium]